MNRKFKSYEQAMQVSEAMKKEIAFVNFRAKSIKEVGANDQKKIQIEGYASTKDKDRYGDVVEPGAFVKTMETYMENPMLLLQHDPEKQIGVVTDYSIDSNGLYINADVKYNAGDAELFDKITNGDLKGFSIGFRIKELELLEEIQDGNTVWTWLIKELELLEISVVTIPANPYTLMKSIDDLFLKSFDVQKKDVGDVENTETTKDKENEEKQEQEPENTEDETPEEQKETPNEDGEQSPEETPAEETPAEEQNTAPTDEPEKQDETPASTEAGETEKQEASFTLKMIDKIVEAKTEAIRKNFEAKEKQIKDELQKDFDERMKAFESEIVKGFEGLMQTISSQADSIKSLTEGMSKMTSGKGFIYKQEDPKDTTDGRDKSILAQLAGAQK